MVAGRRIMMEYSTYSHRYGKEIIKADVHYNERYQELLDVLTNISDKDICDCFQNRKDIGRKDKSLSKVINHLIKKRLSKIGWKSESPIFKGKSSQSDWRLDFVYPELFSVEVAFNHSSATTVNLLKPVLASELNHVEKAFQTKFGIVITANKEMQKAGGFDSAIGTYESYIEHTMPLMNQLTIPLVIIGLHKPQNFFIEHKLEGRKKVGYIKQQNEN